MSPTLGRWVERVLRERASPIEMMREVLRVREEWHTGNWRGFRAPPPDWAALRALDFPGEFDRLTQWIEGLLTDTPPGPDINGLFFCMLYPKSGAPHRTVSMFVTGSRTWGQRKEWMLDQDWIQENCVFTSGVLSAIYRAYVDALRDSISERDEALEICWQWTGLVVAEWISGPLRRKLLGTATSRKVFVGLDAWMGFDLGILSPENTR